MRKETVDIDILVTSGNGDKELEPVEPVQMNIYESNTYRKDLSWLHLNNGPRVQEKQQAEDQHSHISVFLAYLTTPGSK